MVGFDEVFKRVVFAFYSVDVDGGDIDEMGGVLHWIRHGGGGWDCGGVLAGVASTLRSVR